MCLRKSGVDEFFAVQTALLFAILSLLLFESNVSHSVLFQPL